MFDAGEFTRCSAAACAGSVTVWRKNNDFTSFDEDTVFEVTLHGRTHYYSNVASTVRIASSSNVSYGFRNPTHFVSLTAYEATQRDAVYETDAVLDNYFYHANTAPFIAFRLIQRLVTSNPSPR